MGVAAALAVCGMVLAGCGEPPKDADGGDTEKKFKACMVTDIGGVDDRSFNASAWAGMQAAAEANKSVEVDYVTSKAEADYEPNLKQQVQGNCDLVVAVGGLMADATKKVAEQTTDKQFAIVDANIDLANVYSMQFNTAQSSFQAGYLAAATTRTGKVATYGGLPIPPVTIFMDGFYEGVQHYNKVKKKKVAVLGWDPANPKKGSFAESFTDQNKGKAITENFVSQGADIVFPVAGGTGLGTAATAQASNGKLTTIWVDFDGCESAKDFCDVFLTSVVKNIPDAVKEAVLRSAKGEKGDAFLGTLENKGTFLAPYHEFDSKVDAALKAEVEAIGADITSGKIKIASKSQPQ
ncbi:MAG: BMP family lipoprotein [Micromonosporaceae bacterium]